MNLLRSELADYQRIFSEPGVIIIKGTVASGLGEGQYYLNKPGYRNQIIEKLGFTPFNGTLNLGVTEDEMTTLAQVPPASRIKLSSFRADGRTYGEAECIGIVIRDIPCAIVLPKRSHHTDVLEIISATHLRKALGLKDGDTVEITVSPQ
jgi:riboflavin kinase